MKNIFGLLIIGSILSSCVVSTAAKVVKGAAKVTYGAVKGTVKGVSWAVSKAEGKIDDSRLDGKWRLIGVYKGSYDQIVKNGDSENILTASCTSEETEMLTIKARKEKWQPVHCENSKVDWEKYKFKFGKNPDTKEKENYLELADDRNISIINVSDQQLILEGNLIPSYAFSGGKVFLFEKVK